MGTGYHPPVLTAVGCGLARVIAAVKGWHFRSQFINKLAGVPTTVYIDKNGKVVGEAVVGAKVEEYKQHVEDYLNEQK